MKDKELVEYFTKDGKYHQKLVVKGQDIGDKDLEKIISRFSIGQNRNKCEMLRQQPIIYNGIQVTYGVDFPNNHCFIPQIDEHSVERKTILICVNCGMSLQNGQLVKV